MKKKAGSKPRTAPKKLSIRRPAVAVGVTVRGPAPARATMTDSQFHVKRSEFVGTFSNESRVTYAIVPESGTIPGYDGNPACELLFPWLSGVAQRYERYRFNKLSFKFVPSQATTTPGRVYAAWDYDYDDMLPLSKTELMANYSVVDAPVWEPFSLTCNPTQLMRDQPFKYCSGYSRNNFVEPRTAYAGFLLLATDTSTANCKWDMFVEYDVIFDVPVLESFALVDTTGGPADAVDNVTEHETTGHNFVRWVRDGLGSINLNSALRWVKVGEALVPVLSYAGLVPEQVLDLIGQNKNHGSLESVVKYAVTGKTPVENIGTDQPSAAMAAWDSAGTYLGVYNGSSAHASAYDGPSSPYYISTAGALCENSIVCRFKDLFTGFPNARYLAPMMISAVKMGAGTIQPGLKYEL